MPVNHQEIGHSEQGQRLDNYLFRCLKGVPRSRIYKAIRSGEVRVNGGRIRPAYKLAVGDVVRIPPIRVARGREVVIPPRLLEQIPILFADRSLMVVNKPAGIPVHGGSGNEYGLIEAFRALMPDAGPLDLVHRLDRETSGCLLLAKTRTALLGLHQQLGQSRAMTKRYTALVCGHLTRSPTTIRQPIGPSREMRGKGKMQIDQHGRPAHSRLTVQETFAHSSLVEIQLLTGRTHQARVHCTAIGHPLAGDRLYGDPVFNRELQSLGLGRLFLHATTLTFHHPETHRLMEISAPMPEALVTVLDGLRDSEDRGQRIENRG